MRKTLYTSIFFSVILIIFSFFSYKNTSIETGAFTKSNSEGYEDYDDIIIKHGNSEEKMLALTFDDGPDEVFTPQILDILKKYNVRATFFVVGEKVAYNKEIIKREFDEGHEIGNHTYSHINVAKQSYDTIATEIGNTQDAIKSVTGEEPRSFRPPYRAISRDMCNIIKERDMNIILWTYVDAKDWQNPGSSSIVRSIETGIQNGCIILLHDYNKIRNPKSQTIEALDVIIPDLIEKGYKFVTVSELVDHIDKNSEGLNK